MQNIYGNISLFRNRLYLCLTFKRDGNIIISKTYKTYYYV
ncbi:hypothetical protein PRABACTJOHN_03032 [Parabacteroides johnsonii DSM 18315]|uniref:Uncharacterized protein n=1 Tax=Parabacteroides johnsonii DSM 18315 TaxID=537006 RepID=B7BDB2_9BACT|nr:hypothetical protein PRABACTJOHN_03032 [Parabacteroides johnsonii DSM 18315]